MSGDSHRSRGSARAQPNRPSRKQDCVPAAVQPLQARSHGWLRHADLCSPTPPPHLRRVAPAHLPDVAHPEPAGAHASSTHPPQTNRAHPEARARPCDFPTSGANAAQPKPAGLSCELPRGAIVAHSEPANSPRRAASIRAQRGLPQEPARLPTRTASTRAQPGLPGGRELVHASSPQPGRKRDATETRKVVVRASPTRAVTLPVYQEPQACRCDLRPRAVEPRPSSRSAQTRHPPGRPRGCRRELPRTRRNPGLSGVRSLAGTNSPHPAQTRPAGSPQACRCELRPRAAQTRPARGPARLPMRAPTRRGPNAAHPESADSPVRAPSSPRWPRKAVARDVKGI